MTESTPAVLGKSTSRAGMSPSTIRRTAVETCSKDSASELKSHLLPAVLELEAQKDKMLASLDTGEIDLEALNRMTELRASLHAKVPSTPLDALIVYGCIRSVVSYSLLLSQTLRDYPDDQDTQTFAPLQLVDGLQEVLGALASLRPVLEASAGVSLSDLGIFQDSKRAVQ